MMAKRLVKGAARVSRRVFIAIAAVVVLAVLGIVGLLRLRRPPEVVPTPTPTPTPTPAPTPTPTPVPADVTAFKVDKVPVDPDDAKWGPVREFEFTLGPQAMVKPFELAPAVKSVKVKALYDNESVAFRLEWRDEKQDLALDLDKFDDCCAVMLLTHPIPAAQAGEAWKMGTPDYPATILLWKASLQLEAEKGVQDITDLYPNMAIDTYPPYKDTVKEVEPKPVRIGEVKGETAYLAAFAADNPVVKVRLERKPVEKVIGKGPGTITTAKTQDADGKGKWANGVWRVVLLKKLKASDKDQGEVELRPGATYTVAFAVWEGSKGEKASRKGITPLLTLRLE